MTQNTSLVSYEWIGLTFSESLTLLKGDYHYPQEIFIIFEKGLAVKDSIWRLSSFLTFQLLFISLKSNDYYH